VLFADWTIAAGLQHRRYDAVRQTFSVLAAHGAADRWVASLAFVLVGGLDIITGLALRPAARAGRILLAAGGVTGMLVAASPETVGPGWWVMADSTLRHASFGAIGFVVLTVWPVAGVRWGSSPSASTGAARRGKSVPWALRPGPALVASALTAVMFGWFLVELVNTGAVLGLVERGLGEFQALWPLTVVASCLAFARRSQGSRAPDSPAIEALPSTPS